MLFESAQCYPDRAEKRLFLYFIAGIIDKIRRSPFRRMAGFRLPYSPQLFLDSICDTSRVCFTLQLLKRLSLCLCFGSFTPFEYSAR